MNFEHLPVVLTIIGMLAGAISWLAAQQIALAERSEEFALRQLSEARAELDRSKIDLAQARRERDDLARAHRERDDLHPPLGRRTSCKDCSTTK